MRWVDDEDASPISCLYLDKVGVGIKVGDYVSYPYDRRCFGFGWVTSLEGGRLVLDGGKCVSLVGVVVQSLNKDGERKEGRYNGEEGRRYDGGGTPTGTAENKRGEERGWNTEEECSEREEGEWC